MRFFKYHGLGNDFIVLCPEDPAFRIGAGLDAALARALCDRWFGIGADGVMVVAPPRGSDADAAMELINSDGSYPEMCGNGIRCAARHAVEVQGLTRNPLRIETPGGIRDCYWQADAAGRVDSVRVAMGWPDFAPASIPATHEAPGTPLRVEASGRCFEGVGVNIGNPHFVAFGDAAVETARRFGPELEVAAPFLAKANIGFAEVLGPQQIRTTVWERGCGLTFACGTGATAAAAVAVHLGLASADRPISVALRGGTLEIRLDTEARIAWMTGPATLAFTGRVGAELLRD